MDATVQNTNTLAEDASRNLRVCRGYMLGICGALDTDGHYGEAVHSLRLALTSLGDCLDELEKPEPPTRVLRSLLLTKRERESAPGQDTIADDRRDDLMADADRSEYR